MKRHLLFSSLLLFFQSCQEEYPVKNPEILNNKRIKNSKVRSCSDIDLSDRTDKILSRIWSQANPDISTADLYQKTPYDLIFKADYLINEGRWNIFLKWCEDSYVYTLVNNNSDSVNALVDEKGRVMICQEGDVLLKKVFQTQMTILI